MSERKDNCPNCHMRNLGKSNAQVLEDMAQEFEDEAQEAFECAEAAYQGGSLSSEASWLGIHNGLMNAATWTRAKAKEEN